MRFATEEDIIDNMKAKLLLLVFLSGSLLLGIGAEAVKTRPNLYDPTADGNEQIKVALEKAQKENENVAVRPSCHA